MNTHAAQDEERPDARDRAARAGVKFVYASGDRPVDGYTIKRGIGRGGFGEVYFAVSDGGKEVALKLIRRNFDVELRGVAQCINLKHPNLLGLYDVRTDQHDDRWVVMEYLTGESLDEAIAAHPDGMPIHEAVAWMQGIAAGVAYLHDSGIVHRDLKPGNIFSDQGLVKIGDYGLSKFISCSRRSGQTESVGTVHYMAPEIANGRYGKEIDVYALGVMLYEMLTGHVPFEGESVGEVLMKHMMAEPDVTVLDEPFRTIVGRALAKDPEARYPSAAELSAALPATTPAPGRTVSPAAWQGVAAHRAADEPIVAQVVMATVQDPGARGKPSHSASTSREEPLWRWIRTSCAEMGEAWNHQLGTAARVILILAGFWFFLFSAGAMIPALIFVVMGYLVYLAIWTLANWGGANWRADQVTRVPAAPPKPNPPAPLPVTQTAASPTAQPRRRRKRHAPTVRAMPVRSRRERLTELIGSMLLGAMVCLVTNIAMVLLRGEIARPEQFAWLALVSICGTWGILIPSKLWEGRTGEVALRRFWMLVVGLGVGAAAWGLHQILWVDLPHEFTVDPAFAAGRSIDGFQIQALANGDTRAALMTCLSYFGFLFLTVRWWRLCDPLRSARVSLWTTAVCVTWAGILYLLWPFPSSWHVFPQPWGFMLAATIAISVQLSSPWFGPRKKTIEA